MDANRKMYFYKGNIPISFYVLIVLGIIAFSILAVLGLFVGVIVGVVAIGALLVRSLFSSGKKRNKRVDDDGKTIILREDEYEVIERKK